MIVSVWIEYIGFQLSQGSLAALPTMANKKRQKNIGKDKKIAGKVFQKKTKPKVATDGDTILRVEPYLHFGKHTLRPYVQNGQAIFVSAQKNGKKKNKKQGSKAEKKFYTCHNIFEALDADKSEMCRRLPFGLSMKAANVEEFFSFVATNKDDIIEMMDNLFRFLESPDGKKMLSVAKQMNSENESPAKPEEITENVEAFWNFHAEGPEGFEKLLRGLMMLSPRLFLGASSLFECRALVSNFKMWAKKIEPKKQQPKAVRAWMEEPGSAKKAKKALVAALSAVESSKKKKNKKATKMNSDSEDDSSDGTSKSDASSDSSSGSSSGDKAKKKNKKASKKKRSSSSESSSDSKDSDKKPKKKKNAQRRKKSASRAKEPGDEANVPPKARIAERVDRGLGHLAAQGGRSQGGLRCQTMPS